MAAPPAAYHDPRRECPPPPPQTPPPPPGTREPERAAHAPNVTTTLLIGCAAIRHGEGSGGSWERRPRVRSRSALRGGGGGWQLLLRPPFCCCGSWEPARQNHPWRRDASWSSVVGVAAGVGVKPRGCGAGAFQAWSERRKALQDVGQKPGAASAAVRLCPPRSRALVRIPEPGSFREEAPEQAGQGGGCCGPGAERKVLARSSKRASRCAERPFSDPEAVCRAKAYRAGENSCRRPDPAQSLGPTPCPPPGSTPQTAPPGTWGR